MTQKTTHHYFVFCSIFIFLFLNAAVTEARTFKNAYISFEMLDNWKCKLEQTEWVCRSEDPQESKEAVIILTAKEKGPTDTFQLYQDHMSKPMTLLLKGGGSKTSSISIAPRENLINNQKWLDSLHMGSEVQNYFTRYVATIKDDIAILVTFSAHNQKWSKHSLNFNKTIQSLRVIATKDILSRQDSGSRLRGAGESLGAGIGSAMPSDLLVGDDLADGSSRNSLLQNDMVLGLILLILAALAYVGFKIYKKRKG